ATAVPHDDAARVRGSGGRAGGSGRIRRDGPVCAGTFARDGNPAGTGCTARAGAVAGGAPGHVARWRRSRRGHRGGARGDALHAGFPVRRGAGGSGDVRGGTTVAAVDGRGGDVAAGAAREPRGSGGDAAGGVGAGPAGITMQIRAFAATT